MARGSLELQVARPNYLLVALCGALILAVVGNVALDVFSDTDAIGSEREVHATTASDLTASVDARHGDEECGHDHKSSECSPCPSCFASLAFTMGPDTRPGNIARAAIPSSHYDDVVPTGIRRPPRSI